MNNYNVNVLAEAKEEYQKQLVNILYPEILVGIKSIYDVAYKYCNEISDKNILKKFQQFLSNVPKWNQDKIDGEYNRISNTTECDFIEDLITAVFVSHTKILSSIKLKKNSKPIPLNVPIGSYFIHKCYIESARNFWKKAWLLDNNLSAIEIQRNQNDSELLIKESIVETVRKLLPVKYILKQYLGNDYQDDLNDEFTNALSSSTKDNLRNLVKQEIEEQSLQKNAELNDNFSQLEIKNIDEIDINIEDKQSAGGKTKSEPHNEDIHNTSSEEKQEPVNGYNETATPGISNTTKTDDIIMDISTEEHAHIIPENNEKPEAVDEIGDKSEQSEQLNIREKTEEISDKPEQSNISEEVDIVGMEAVRAAIGEAELEGGEVGREEVQEEVREEVQEEVEAGGEAHRAADEIHDKLEKSVEQEQETKNQDTRTNDLNDNLSDSSELNFSIDETINTPTDKIIQKVDSIEKTILNKKNEGISDYLDTLSESKDIKDIYNNITENSTEDCTENKMDPFSFFEDAAM
jgi:hypothetical protein